MAQLSSSLKALRALSALFLRRLLHPVFFMIVILLVAGYVLTALLAVAFSSWWLLLLIIFLPLTVIFLVLSYVMSFLLRKLLPHKLPRSEHKQIDAYIEKLFSIAEQSKTPYPVLLFLIAKDVIRGKESAFLNRLIGDSKSLVREFGEIQKLF